MVLEGLYMQTIFFLQYKLLTLKVLIKETSEQHTIMKLFAKLPIN